ncbi:replicative DNA helicase [Mycolicibacterium fortuitum]|uniref:Replicative DNA helicase n=2 Tax=Mycolicibacterium fortuitum TaxID=1766 RepID=A0A0N9XLX1_MYCFO|nr:replicative DNA helicase [Mycolicibacterium fortuitum]AIY49025.1 Replicative DNA helicase, intein-containing [Mycobacterium sp. VKM Ac-1817D]ALI29833.1 Replicative DNA helicase [Mycolicibacterium fortuitum]EJZ13938.1 replicative DNA helicase [Mycolicibacterium fortuitum subsp. fortuitum DSM 46621 = ATCC 6841 = JCM 6387]MCA4721285.1 replicative DNA helicase [Mycolicibacterium fortuitum]MCA4753380.1 replicative DNA helicase [Mycolicibacterium fortuitum]
MAVVDDLGHPDSEMDGPPPGEDFGRQPPQDMAAEQAVLGGMLLSKDAIADVLERLRPGDFYRPAHQNVYDAILDLYGRGEPADAVTVAAELDRRGLLRRIGGAPYLHTLISTVPTAANAGFYAGIVAEKALLRRLVEAGTRVVQYGYAGADGADVTDVVDRAQAEIYDVTERRASEDFVALEDLLQPTMDEIDAIASQGGIARGVPTGFTEFDEITNGLHPGQMIIIAARPGVGKALALDTPLPTPTGWTSMGDVGVGDHLLGPDGEPTRVVAATEVMLGRPCFEVEFSDGTVIVADAQHQWPTGDGIRTTTQLRPGLHTIAAPTCRGGAAVLAPVSQVAAVRRLPSVPVRCVEVDNAAHLYLAGPAMVPTHNSTLGLDFMRSCSIKHRMASVIFSLEMSKSEIVMRLLSAEAKIKLADMRSGRMSDDDWTKLARRMSEISEAPLYIDDSPNLTMMEIRAKGRRLAQKADLKLVVVDYMQLMSSGKKYESRQQEVSDFSRSLKLMAKELEVPVIAISQLNRGPEQRTDKRPQVSDLRESGCMTANTRILRADNGAEVTFGELMATGERPLVWSLDEHKNMVARPMTNVFYSGHKEVFKLRLASGREVEATANHPFMTIDGWVPLGELAVGDRLATPRRIPEPVHTERMHDSEVVMLAHMIGDGSCVKRQPIRYASVDEANLVAVEISALHFGVTAVRDDYPAAGVTTLRLPAPYRLTHGKRNPIAAWLDRLGLFGKRSYEKFVPKEVFALPDDQVALFLRHLWATDGSVRWDAKAGQARIYYATSSRRLADDVTQLLLRVGVHARIKRAKKPGYRDCWHVLIYGWDNQRRFVAHVGVNGERGIKAREVLAHLEDAKCNPNLDTVPKEVWQQVKSALSREGMTHRQFAAAMGTKFCGSTMWKHAPSRSRLHRAAAVLNDPELHHLALNDVFWDEIVEITSIGEHDVYDGTVPGTSNFVAQGITAHNSLEQDADMVLLLHRPDAIDREDPRGGEADIILGKHRNGPTANITVAHQLHFSRFTNMAR